jgi:hypothetical protein
VKICHLTLVAKNTGSEVKGRLSETDICDGFGGREGKKEEILDFWLIGCEDLFVDTGWVELFV